MDCGFVGLRGEDAGRRPGAIETTLDLREVRSVDCSFDSSRSRIVPAGDFAWFQR
ncbi:MAG: hypothetical protein AVDCRST_MAG68-4771 [uncultured Gemmatimonadetes bacterium]|uniref:Uncharacterized protein n=1 Tax=uncultured Gemmatimonadota bacterium TaxID=203437 RepID=A0A6J4MPI4_9BACT|nr:MAG: hypothetical protein AVDCRST_MAG68-4771 [uncultured Gemmatimonadota bacterium]